MALVRILDAGLKRAARGSLKIQDAKVAKKSPSGSIWQTSNLRRLRLGEEKRKEERRNHRTKI